MGSPITDIHHMSAFTKDEKLNFNFYTKVLGLRLVANTIHQENRNVRHLFYGDQKATPGTLFTFFVYPKMGKTYPHKAFFSTVVVRIPVGSSEFWNQRLSDHKVDFTLNSDGTISLQDPDNLEIKMVESSQIIEEDKATTHSDIPRDKQIIKIMDQKIRVSDLEKEQQFLEEWLGLTGNPAANDSQTFKLSLKESGSDKRSRMGHGTIDHIALGVDTKEELITLKDRAEELGLKIDMYKERGFFTSLYVKDPHGLRFEIATNTPGFDLNGDLHELRIPKHFKQYEDEIIENLGGKIND